MNRIEHYKLILECNVTTDVAGGIDKFSQIKEKKPIVMYATRLIPETETTFPKQPSLKEITKYLCDEMTKYVDNLGDDEIAAIEAEGKEGMLQTLCGPILSIL